MSQAVEVKVPDIGDFKEVEVIEVLVKPGDTIAKDQSLVTVESDKASMEIPSSSAGVVKEMRVKLGDKVSQGSPLLVLEATSATAAAPSPASAPAPAPAAAAPKPASAPSPSPAPVVASFGGAADIECEMLVLGAGPGGYSAAFRAADLGMKTVLVERYSTLGGVCLNVGCIPSKALLHVAAVMDEAAHFAALGVEFGAPKIDLEKLRAHKAKVVGKLTGGLERHGEDAQGHDGARRRPVRRTEPPRSAADVRPGPGADRREDRRAVREGHHRRRLAGREAALHPRGSAHRRLDRRAGTARACRSGCW